MPEISLKNGLISYYGNEAVYTEKEVADPIFQNDELSEWFKSRSLACGSTICGTCMSSTHRKIFILQLLLRFPLHSLLKKV